MTSPTRMPSGRAPGTATTATTMSRSVITPTGRVAPLFLSVTTSAPTCASRIKSDASRRLAVASITATVRLQKSRTFIAWPPWPAPARQRGAE
jgi:hypothetical protein